MKTYIDDYSKTLKTDLYYSKGGMNYFTGTNEARGFYLSVTSVEITKGKMSDGKEYEMESFTAFTGTKKLLLEVKRYSKASELKAEALKPDVLPTLISHVVSKNNLTKKQVA